MNKKDFYSLLQSVPKAELHIHSEAVVSRKTVKELYKNSTGKTMTAQEMKDLFTYEDLPGFLKAFISIQNMYTSPSDFELIMRDFSDYLKANNIVYVEAFFSPTSFVTKGFDFHNMIQTLSSGIKKCKTEENRTVKLLIDVSRSFGMENAMRNLDMVLAENNKDIIGIGLGGDEAKGPAKEYGPVFDKAKEMGLHTVSHAGETVESQSIKDSIKYLHSERIGHGITAAYDPELIQKLKKTKLPLEVCPSSNTFTKHYVKTIQEHPIKELYEKGVFVTVNTDDPTFFKVSLIDEYWNLYSKLHFTLDQIQDLILNSFKAAFISDSMKRKYCAQVKEAWQEWFQQHPEAK